MFTVAAVLIIIYVVARLIGMAGHRLDNDRHEPRGKRVYYPKWWSQEQIDQKMRDVAEREKRKPWWLR
jgi:hypothetical protein